MTNSPISEDVSKFLSGPFFRRRIKVFQGDPTVRTRSALLCFIALEERTRRALRCFIALEDGQFFPPFQSQYHLIRTGIRKAKACFIFPSQTYDSLEEEDEGDLPLHFMFSLGSAQSNSSARIWTAVYAEVVLIALNVKKYSPNTKIFAMVFSMRSYEILKAAGIKMCQATNQVNMVPIPYPLRHPSHRGTNLPN